MALASFHSAVQRWFEQRGYRPTPPQEGGWPAIRRGEHTLIAAPTGSGKTLAGFLSAIDALLREAAETGGLPDETRILYLSPLKALARDVQKNLEAPLTAIRAIDPSLAEVRVAVRTGDTEAKARAAAVKRPPHIFVTTPESLYILLTSDGGRRMLKTVRTVIVDEIHALARDKRGSHLALSLERLDALVGPRGLQRIGLSATQKPIEDMASFLVGAGRPCAIVDTGHLRHVDLGIEMPRSPLEAVCSHEVWDEIHARIAALVEEHRTTLIFVNTRRLAERLAARLGPLLGQDDDGRDRVACHHGSLSAERRLEAETRLKNGELRALVATASLELGIDIGDVDLVVQVGAARSVATLLQRVGRAGHGVGRIPKGRIFPLTRDELVEARAIVDASQRGVLDRILMPDQPMDILAQQVVAICASETWDEDELFRRVVKAWPYRDLTREQFDEVVAVHSRGRLALLHRDGTTRRLRATKRAPLTAVTGGGAIPDTADYRVMLEPDGTFIGTLNEDFAIESGVGDVFQLGTTSWQILRVEQGTVRVVDAKGAPPTIPFWLGEAPARTRELSDEISAVRKGLVERLTETTDPRDPVATQLREYVDAGVSVLGVVPARDHVVLERFFDESGGMQLVVHAPFGGRILRAWGLALRKRFCRGFGFELQAAANDEAIVLSLGQQHSFPLEEVFDYLHPNTARELLVQAIIGAPMFQTRWRWNATRSLLLERARGGKRVPPPILRMRAEDLLAASFPAAVACPETLPGGDVEVPMDHPIVRQTIEDCLHEAMDVDGFLDVLRGLRDGSIRRHAVDTTSPSVFAHGILSSQPYTFLDDAPLEERRTRAVIARRGLPVAQADELGALDPEAIARVRAEAWPAPENEEEVHEALSWMGFVTSSEAPGWLPWLTHLRAAGRVVQEGDRWYAAFASRDPKEILRGRLEALGPMTSDDPAMLALEAEGAVVRGRFEGREGWCSRRLLARIHRYTLDRLRKEIEPVSTAELLQFLAAFQHVDDAHRLEGPRGVAQVVKQLAGFELPAAAWEASVLPARVRNYKREWLDQLTLSGEVTWGRLWSRGSSAIRTTPITLVCRDDLELWTRLAEPWDDAELSEPARAIRDALAARGAMFLQELARAARLDADDLERGLGELVAAGAVTHDSFGALRTLLTPAHRRRFGPTSSAGRFSFFRRPPEDGTTAAASGGYDEELTVRVARQLLTRTGVVFRKVTLREKFPVPWRDLLRVFRTLEARGEIRGGRFVAGYDGEQYALPEALTLLRATRKKQREAGPAAVFVAAADPLNLRGILTPEPRVATTTRGLVQVG